LDGSGSGTVYADQPELQRKAGNENLTIRYPSDTPEQGAKAAFDAWMVSQGHKATLMDKYCVGFALGIYYGETNDAGIIHKWSSYAYTGVIK